MNKQQKAEALFEAAISEYERAIALAKSGRKKAAKEASYEALELMLQFHSLVKSHEVSDRANRIASQWQRKLDIVFVRKGWLDPSRLRMAPMI